MGKISNIRVLSNIRVRRVFDIRLKGSSTNKFKGFRFRAMDDSQDLQDDRRAAAEGKPNPRPRTETKKCGLGVRVWGLECGVWGVYRVWCSRLRTQDPRPQIQSFKPLTQHLTSNLPNHKASRVCN